MLVQRPENLRCVKQMRVIVNPSKKKSRSSVSQSSSKPNYRNVSSRYHRVDQERSILLSVKDDQWQVQNQRHPVSINKEQRSQESVHSGFGDDVGIEAVAEIDGVDVVAFQIRVPGLERETSARVTKA